MTETRNTGDKTIHAPQQQPRKPLGLKPRGVERDTVRQSFSHGRTKTVQVERKKRRVTLPGETKPEPAPKPLASAGTSPTRAACRACRPPTRGASAAGTWRGRNGTS